MNITGPIWIGFAVLATVALFIQSGFLLLGARIAGVENRTFGKAVGTTLLGGVAAFILSRVLASIPGWGPALAFFGGFVASALVMMPIFRIGFGRALGATVLAWILGLLILGGAILGLAILLGGMAALG
jgi:hypothetical protein